MKLTCSYEKLLSTIQDVSSVVEDNMLDDNMKNIIFLFDKQDNSVTLMAINQLITYRRVLPYEEYSLEITDEEYKDGKLFIQLKSKELINFLGSFKGLRCTKIDEVFLETTPRGKIRCVVIESSTDSDGGAPSDSCWIFDNLPINRNLEANINLSYDGELTQIDKTEVQFHTNNLFPSQSNVNTINGYLMFGEEYVVVFNTHHVAFMKNLITEGGIFSGIKLSYKASSFLDRLVSNFDNLSFAKTDRHLVVKTDDSEAFIVYDTRLADFSNFVPFERERGIILERVRFKDMLKRFSSLTEFINFEVVPDEGVMYLKTTKLETTIPILNQKALDGVASVSFKVSGAGISKAIIGVNDDEFPMELRIYFQEHCGNAQGLCLTDSSEANYSIIKTKVTYKDAAPSAPVPPVQ